MTVRQGGTYGTMPVPVRSGYDFEGWFTSPHAAALEYKEDSICLFGGKQILYAHWKESSNAILRFDACGGTVSPSNQTIPRSGTYSSLPTPVRSGYTFDGWFNMPQYAGDDFLPSMRQIKNGDRYSFTGEQTLYAHWSKITAAKQEDTDKQEETVTLVFSAEGGIIGTKRKTVTKGEAIGSLPSTIKRGYTFLGWYTAASGGKKVTSTTIADKGMTLYAHWQKDESDETKPSGTDQNTVTPSSQDTPNQSTTNGSGTNTIIMTLGSKYLSINGKRGTIDNNGTKPVARNNRTLVPVRAVLEAMGGTVDWDAATQVIPLSMDGKTLYLQLNNTASWDSTGKYYTLDTAPVAINSRTMLPIRFVVEYFGGNVNWDANTNTIKITY